MATVTACAIALVSTAIPAYADDESSAHSSVTVSGTNWYWSSQATVSATDDAPDALGLGNDGETESTQLLTGVPEGDIGVSHQPLVSADQPAMTAAVILSVRNLERDPTLVTITLTPDPDAPRNPLVLPPVQACRATEHAYPDPGPTDAAQTPDIDQDSCVKAEPGEDGYTIDITSVVRTWRTDPALPPVLLITPVGDQAEPYTLALRGGRDGVRVAARMPASADAPDTTTTPAPPTTTSGRFTGAPTAPAIDSPQLSGPPTSSTDPEPPGADGPELASLQPIATPLIPSSRFNTAAWLAGFCLLLVLAGLRRGADPGLSPQRALFVERLRSHVER